MSAVMLSLVFGFTESPRVNANLLEGFFRSERARKVQACNAVQDDCVIKESKQ